MISSGKHTRTWVPWLVFTLSLLVTLTGWRALSQQQTRGVQRATFLASRQAEVLVRRDLRTRVAAIDSMARMWHIDSMPRSALSWQSMISDAQKYGPHFEAIALVDTDLQVRYDTPTSVKQRSIGLLDRPQIVATAQEAQRSGELHFTGMLEWEPGERGFLGLYPLLRSGQPDGFIVVGFSALGWLASVFPDLERVDFDLKLRVGEQWVVPPSIDEDLSLEKWTRTHDFVVLGVPWQVQIRPDMRQLQAAYLTSSHIVLVASVLLSTLLGLMTLAILNARERSRRIRISDQRLVSVLQSIPAMAYRSVVDTPGAPSLFVSEGCLALTGYSREEFEDARITLDQIVHPEDSSAIRQPVRDIIDQQAPIDIEYRIRTRDGQLKWVLEKVRVRPGIAGEGATVTNGLVSDISEQKRVQTALADARSFAQAVVDSAAEAVIVSNSDGFLESFNQAAEEMFGYRALDIIGCEAMQLAAEPDRQALSRVRQDILEAEPGKVVQVGRETRGLHADGHRFPIHVSVSLIEHEGQRKLVSVIRDLSKQYAAEQDARDQRERLAHMDRQNLLGEMTAGIAHEINQPLSAIAMYAQAARRMLASTAPESARLVPVLDKLAKQSLRAGAIIERMQQLIGKRDSRRELVNCNALIDEVRTLAEAEARFRDMTIDRILCDHTPLVFADPVQIQQVLLNLLRNGMEAMQSAHAELTDDAAPITSITIRTETLDDAVQVSVIDAGDGVTDDAAASLFQPFSSSKANGMGIGLSISHSIINDHGGKLAYSNLPDGGACFWFTLPIAPEGDLST